MEDLQELQELLCLLCPVDGTTIGTASEGMPLEIEYAASYFTIVLGTLLVRWNIREDVHGWFCTTATAFCVHRVKLFWLHMLCTVQRI